jgi:Patatin-like phospholipase
MSPQRTHLETPSQSCDIVMKGGITSGVVYPLALVALSKKYRLANIGGTSAGAIAAAAAAAAEYGRHVDGAGFDRLAKIPAEVGPHLLSLFQPTPVLKPLFNIFVATHAKILSGYTDCPALSSEQPVILRLPSGCCSSV